MDIRHTPLKPDIEIELLKFKDGIRHIDLSLERGHITKDQAHSQRNKLASIHAQHIGNLVDRKKGRGRYPPHRYLVQFRLHSEEHFTTDCGFHQGGFDLAREYVRIVVDTLADIAEGRVVDKQTVGIAYRYIRPITPQAVLEEQIMAVFGERQDLRDPNGSEGIDDDPFVKYSGPDDSEIRYR